MVTCAIVAVRHVDRSPPINRGGLRCFPQRRATRRARRQLYESKYVGAVNGGRRSRLNLATCSFLRVLRHAEARGG